ncbi:MAG: helicase-associated domain-containing protein, partial [Rhodoglobus sp.]
MPTTNSPSLELAAQLRKLTDTELQALLETRKVKESSVHDFFDLADALLDPESIQRALQQLDRPTLITIATLAASTTASVADAAAALSAGAGEPSTVTAHLLTAQNLALLSHSAEGSHLLGPVAVQLQKWPQLGLPSLDELKNTAPPAAGDTHNPHDRDHHDLLCAERAFATLSELGDLLAELQHEPARERERGGIAAADGRRLAASMNVVADRIGELLDLAQHAGLIAVDCGHWVATSASATWALSNSGERWAVLAHAWHGRLPASVRALLHERASALCGEELPHYLDWLFPAGGHEVHERLLGHLRDAQLLGIATADAPSRPGIALLRQEPGATVAMMALFPPEVAQVYLQHDLSIISPGP